MVVIGYDKAGLALIDRISAYFEEKKIAYRVALPEDGSEFWLDYPDAAKAVAEAVAAGECEKGLLICGTGIGMSIAANKVHGIRAAVCGDTYSAQMTRRHNDANVLCIGARVLGDELAMCIVDAFFTNDFEGDRHARRVGKITAMES